MWLELGTDWVLTILMIPWSTSWQNWGCPFPGVHFLLGLHSISFVLYWTGEHMAAGEGARRGIGSVLQFPRKEMAMPSTGVVAAEKSVGWMSETF